MKLTTETIKKLIKEELSKLLREGPWEELDDILDEYYDEIEYSVLKSVYDDMRQGIDSQSSVMGPLFGIKLVLNDVIGGWPRFNYHFRMALENLEFDKPANLEHLIKQQIGWLISKKEEAQEIVMKAELIIAILALYQMEKLWILSKDKGIDRESITKLVEAKTFEGMMQAIELVMSLFHERELDHVIENVLMGLGIKDDKDDDSTTAEREAIDLIYIHHEEIERGVLKMVVADLKQNGVDMFMDDLKMAKPSYHKYFQYAATKAANLDEDLSYEVAALLERSYEGEDIIMLAEMILAIKVLQKQKKLDEFFEMGDLYPTTRVKLLNLLNSSDPESIAQGLEFLMSIYEEEDFQDILSGVNYQRNK